MGSFEREGKRRDSELYRSQSNRRLKRRGAVTCVWVSSSKNTEGQKSTEPRMTGGKKVTAACTNPYHLHAEEVGSDDVLDHVTRLIGTVSMERMYMKPKLRNYSVFHRMVSTCRKNR